MKISQLAKDTAFRCRTISSDHDAGFISSLACTNAQALEVEKAFAIVRQDALRHAAELCGKAADPLDRIQCKIVRSLRDSILAEADKLTKP